MVVFGRMVERKPNELVSRKTKAGEVVRPEWI